MEVNKYSSVYYYLKDNNKPKKKKIINKMFMYLNGICRKNPFK
jgi:hypothetical protein